jgi:alpha-N-arabinofuranosidase
VYEDYSRGRNVGNIYALLHDTYRKLAGKRFCHKVAASSLNIFNNHCERVRMAELAQTVKVLQALVLTEKDKMLLTPTYHVFDLYKVHQDATLLPLNFTSPDYTVGKQTIPAVNISASRDSTGAIHITLVNLDPSKNITINTSLNAVSWKAVTRQIITSPKLTDINTFDNPNKVYIEKFAGAKKQGNQLSIALPAQSVVMLELK